MGVRHTRIDAHACGPAQVLGHHTRGSTIKCFTMIRPRWRSIGYAQALMLFYALSYYNVMVSYAAIYMVGSLQSPLPWTEAAIDMSLASQHNQSASEYFWAHVVLNKFDSLEGQGLGPVQPRIAGALHLHLHVWTDPTARCRRSRQPKRLPPLRPFQQYTR